MFSKNNCDTLYLPLTNGELKDNSKSDNIFFNSLETIIYPTSSIEVKSCSDGKVASIMKTTNNRFAVIILSDTLVYTYVINKICVEKGEYVKKAQIIGNLNSNSAENTPEENYLVFVVSKKDKTLNATKFLIYK